MHIDTLESRRLFAAGQIDISFGGGDGSVDVPFAASAAALDDYGRAILVGGDRAHHRLRLARLKTDGTPDRTFGVDGVATLRVPQLKSDSSPVRVAVDHRGRTLVVAGGRLIRFKASGVLDKSFGDRGRATLPVAGAMTDVAVDAANRPIVGGEVAGRTGARAAIVRLDARGRPDAAFARAGVYKSPAIGFEHGSEGPGPVPLDTRVTSLADGRILAAANSYGEYYGGVELFRLDAGGAIDSGYGNLVAGSPPGLLHVGGPHDNGIIEDDATFAAFLPGGRVLLASTDFLTDTRDYAGWKVSDADGRGAPLAKNFGGDYDTPFSVVGIGGDGAVLTNGRGTFSRYVGSFSGAPTFALDATFAPPGDLSPEIVLARATDLLALDVGATSTRVTALGR